MRQFFVFFPSLIDSREFFQPVLTPFELEVALNPSRDWEPKLVTDFRKLLPGVRVENTVYEHEENYPLNATVPTDEITSFLESLCEKIFFKPRNSPEEMD